LRQYCLPIKVTSFDENIKKSYSVKNVLTFSLDLDLDPELDPDPLSSKRLDPDPHIMYEDPKHCKKVPVLK
jgi:hypothetical protein